MDFSIERTFIIRLIVNKIDGLSALIQVLPKYKIEK